MNQTPFPSEFLSGRTNDFKGQKTVWAKALRASWGKRQATLQITISADGQNRCQPLIIFRGLGEGKTVVSERLRYDSRDRVIFNPKEYSNERVTLDWMETYFFPTWAKAYPGKPCFLVLDVFAGSKKQLLLQLSVPQTLSHYLFLKAVLVLCNPSILQSTKLSNWKLASFLMSNMTKTRFGQLGDSGLGTEEF